MNYIVNISCIFLKVIFLTCLVRNIAQSYSILKLRQKTKKVTFRLKKKRSQLFVWKQNEILDLQKPCKSDKIGKKDLLQKRGRCVNNIERFFFLHFRRFILGLTLSKCKMMFMPFPRISRVQTPKWGLAWRCASWSRPCTRPQRWRSEWEGKWELRRSEKTWSSR